MTGPVTAAQIIATGWPAAESHDAAERPERARAILALFEPLREELAAACSALAIAGRERSQLALALQEYRASHEAAIQENAALRGALEGVDRLNSHSGLGGHCTCSQKERTDVIAHALRPERYSVRESDHV